MREANALVARLTAGLILCGSCLLSLGAVLATGAAIEAAIGAPIVVVPWSLVVAVTAVSCLTVGVARRSQP